MGQDQQTVGIPIGPDTSLLIAELIMQRCDQEIQRRIKGVKGHRFIDDYELGFPTRNDAEDAYHQVEHSLGHFELALNPLKTHIISLPMNLEDAWVPDIRSFEFSSKAAEQRRDLRRYFDLAFRHQQAHKGKPVLQLAVARLRDLEIHTQCWEPFQHLLLLAASPYPACLSYVLDNIISRASDEYSPDKEALEEVLNTLINRHAVLPHSSEVAWSLWACIALDIPIHSDAVQAIDQSEDSVIALLALHAESLGRTNGSLSKAKWLPHMTTAGLYDDQWLLAYEAAVKNWLPSHRCVDHIAKDPVFAWMRQNNVSFYDEAQAQPSSSGAAPQPKPPTSAVFLFPDASVALHGVELYA